MKKYIKQVPKRPNKIRENIPTGCIDQIVMTR